MSEIKLIAVNSINPHHKIGMEVARVFCLLIRLSQENHRQSHSPMYKQRQWAHAMAWKKHELE